MAWMMEMSLVPLTEMGSEPQTATLRETSLVGLSDDWMVMQMAPLMETN